MAKRLPWVPGPRSWREEIEGALLDAEPEAADTDRLNAYWCGECHGFVVTRDVHKGVTPMFLACRVKGEPGDPANACKGQATSCMYRLEMLAMYRAAWELTQGGPAGDEAAIHARAAELAGEGWPDPSWEWFMPTLREIRRIERHNPALGEHLRKGGLHLRRVET